MRGCQGTRGACIGHAWKLNSLTLTLPFRTNLKQRKEYTAATSRLSQQKCVSFKNLSLSRAINGLCTCRIDRYPHIYLLQHRNLTHSEHNFLPQCRMLTFSSPQLLYSYKILTNNDLAFHQDNILPICFRPSWA